MKILAMADLHIGNNPYFGIEVIVNAFKYAVDYAAERKVEVGVIAGDFLDEHKPDGRTLLAGAECLEYAGKKGMIIAIVTGNHEVDEHNCSVLAHMKVYKKDLSHVKIATREPLTMGLVDGTRFVLLPYGCKIGDTAAIFDEYPCKRNILVAHDDVIGCSYDSTHRVKRGIPPATLELSPFDMGIFGHLHNPQEIGCYNGRSFFYLGSLIQCSFRAVHQQRGFYIIDTETLERESHWRVGGEWPVFYLAYADDPIPDMVDDKLAHVTVEAEAGAPIEEIAKKYYDAGAAYVRVKTKAVVQHIERRSDVSMDDTFPVMAEKYAAMKLSDNVDDYQRAMEVFHGYYKDIAK